MQENSAVSEAPIVKTGRQNRTNITLQITMSASLLSAVIIGPSGSKNLMGFPSGKAINCGEREWIATPVTSVAGSQ